MKNAIRLCIAIGLGLILAASLFADTLTQKNGQILNGKVVFMDDKEVVFHVDGAAEGTNEHVDRGNVASLIIGDQQGTAPPNTEPPANPNCVRPGEAIPDHTAKTDLVGGNAGPSFIHVSNNHAPVLGFSYRLGKSRNTSVVREFIPIFIQSTGNSTPNRVVAKDGYAVAGLLVNASQTGCTGFQVIFMRLKDGHLDPSDTYKSDWIGDSDSQSPVQLAGNGQTVVGIFGRGNSPLIAVGLIVQSLDGKTPLTQSLPTTQPAPGSLYPPLAIRKLVMPPGNSVTDEEIGDAIKKGADSLIAQYDKGGMQDHPGFGTDKSEFFGTQAICDYALLQCGQAIKDDRLNAHSDFVNAMIANLKSLDMHGHCETYARSLRIAALTVLNRPEDRDCVKQDAAYLLKVVDQGSYTYGLTVDNPQLDQLCARLPNFVTFDNSNSQYGLLGVWLASEANDVEVPLSYWQQVQKHWDTTQHDDGAWGYRDNKEPDEPLSMVAAGIVSEFVCHDYIDPASFGASVGRDPFSPPLTKGLQWLEDGDRSVKLSDRGDRGAYCLYGLERVGLASGFKYFGTHDWYRELARDTIAHQNSRVGWGQSVTTAYSLLFLARGRHPILMNKLRFDGFWANRPRDVANLARYASNDLERPFNWQVNSITRDWTDWMDSPILYISSHVAPKFTDSQIDNIRQYILNGGMLFTQADGSSPVFDKYAAQLAKTLFPQYELKDVPQDSELFTKPYPVTPRPPLKMLSNGTRILMFHSPTDISQAWQMRTELTRKNLFQLGLNMYLMAAGHTESNNRLATTVIPEPPKTAQNLQIARVKYAGNWDPEPAAWPRFARWFTWQTSVGINTAPVEISSLNPHDYPFAHITGNAAFSPTDDQFKALGEYVRSGGILIIDSCGGSNDFGDPVSSGWLPKIFPDAKPRTLSLEDPILLGNFDGGQAIDHFDVRQDVVERYHDNAPQPLLIQYGSGFCVFSPLDITTGLLGTRTWNILGYEPDMARNLLKNIILWSYANVGDKKQAAGK